MKSKLESASVSGLILKLIDTALRAKDTARERNVVNERLEADPSKRLNLHVQELLTLLDEKSSKYKEELAEVCTELDKRF